MGRCHAERHTTIGITLFNIRNGCLNEGHYNFDTAVDLISEEPEYCDLMVFCEAKEFAWRGGAGRHGFTNALKAATGRPLAGELGSFGRGEFGPIVVYDPNVVDICVFQGYGAPFIARDKRNWCTARIRESGAHCGILPQHWAYQDGDLRLAEAKETAWVGGLSFPALILGDFNSIASGGSEEPHCDFALMRDHERYNKAQWTPDSKPGRPIVADTRALDFLLGHWQSECSSRIDGRGLHDLAEIAHYTYGERGALVSTVNDGIDLGGGLRIDRALINTPGRSTLVRGSFLVRSTPPPFDHKIVRFKLHL